jgi:hypothetical protein
MRVGALARPKVFKLLSVQGLFPTYAQVKAVVHIAPESHECVVI